MTCYNSHSQVILCDTLRLIPLTLYLSLQQGYFYIRYYTWVTIIKLQNAPPVVVIRSPFLLILLLLAKPQFGKVL